MRISAGIAARLFSLTLTIMGIASIAGRAQPTTQELTALNNLPINGLVVLTRGTPTSEMGRGQGVYRFDLKTTTADALFHYLTVLPSS